MNTVFRVSLREWLNQRGRAALAILALAVGLWGVGGMLVSYFILTRDLNENFLRTNPAHVVLTSPDFARLDLSVLRDNPAVESAEFRDLTWLRIEVHPDVWIPMWLFGIDDFARMQLARFSREQGNAVPAPHTILIERNARLVSNLDLGTHARVRAGQQILNVPISGIVFDPGQAPGTQDHFVYAYTDKKTFGELSGEPFHQRLLLRLNHIKTKKDVQTAVKIILDQMHSAGISVTTVHIPSPDTHPHQWQLNTLLALQGSIGWLAFLMGAVLVSQLMASLLAKQVRRIGVLKAIGASRRRIYAIYLAMVLVPGFSAGIIAIPLAMSSGYAFSHFVAGILNFNILTAQPPLSLYFALISAALLLPVTLSWPLIAKSVRIPVREALHDYGVSLSQPSRAQPARIVFAWLPLRLQLAARNSLRRKRRLAVTVATMALGVALFSTGFNVRESLARFLTQTKESMRYDVQVVLKDAVPREHALAVFTSLANVDSIETWSGGRGELQTRVVAANDGIGIVALPYATTRLQANLLAGRWLQGTGVPEIVLNQQAWKEYGHPAVGSLQTVAIAGKAVSFKLAGIIQEFDKAKIYMDQRLYDGLANAEHRINNVLFTAKDNRLGRILDLKKNIEQAITGSGLSVLYVMSQAERLQIIYDHLNIILTTLLFLSLLVLVVSALGMASATGINIMERTREIGVSRAIGATSKSIFQLFVTEGMITCVAGILLGLLLAWPLSAIASGFFGQLILGPAAVLTYAFSLQGIFITLLTTLIFAWLASRLPAGYATAVPTRDALSYQ